MNGYSFQHKENFKQHMAMLNVKRRHFCVLQILNIVIYFAFLSLGICIIYFLRQVSPVFNKVCVFPKFPNFLPFIAGNNQDFDHSEVLGQFDFYKSNYNILNILYFFRFSCPASAWMKQNGDATLGVSLPHLQKSTNARSLTSTQMTSRNSKKDNIFI